MIIIINIIVLIIINIFIIIRIIVTFIIIIIMKLWETNQPTNEHEGSHFQ